MGLFSTDYIPVTVVPPRAITGNTVKPQGPEATICHKCGAPYVPGKDFCVECGTSKKIRHTLSMTGKRMKALELARYLNGWLAENPYMYDVKLNAQLHYLPNDFDRVGQISATEVELSYCLAQQEQSVQYGVEYVYTYKATFDVQKIMNITSDSLVQQWQQANPALKVQNWFGGRVTSMDNGTYQLYALIVYAKPVDAAPVQAQPAMKFCHQCGKQVAAKANFCSGCGAKL